MKVKLVLVSILGALILTGCGNANSTVETSVVTPEQTESVEPIAVEEKEKSEEIETVTEVVSEDPFERFENGLQANDISFEVTRVDSTLIGGEIGYRYTLEDGRVELYQFDIDSEAYLNAVEKGVITVELFGDFKVAATSNGMVLIFDGLSNEEPILNLFETLFN